MLTVTDKVEGGKICQILADVICERSLRECCSNDFCSAVKTVIW